MVPLVSWGPVVLCCNELDMGGGGELCSKTGVGFSQFFYKIQAMDSRQLCFCGQIIRFHSNDVVCLVVEQKWNKLYLSCFILSYLLFFPLMVCLFTEIEMSSFWWHFCHWLHQQLATWQLPVQPMIKKSSKIVNSAAMSKENFVKMTCLFISIL